MKGSAKITNYKNNTYRYCLCRTWNKELKKALFIMINPSEANENDPDETLKRCINMFKNNENFNEIIGGIIVVNLFPQVSQVINNLELEDDEIKNENFKEIEKFRSCKDIVVTIAAWGTRNKLPSDLKDKFEERVNFVKSIFPELKCLRLLTDGNPQHPLYAGYPDTMDALVDYIKAKG